MATISHGRARRGSLSTTGRSRLASARPVARRPHPASGGALLRSASALFISVDPPAAVDPASPSRPSSASAPTASSALTRGATSTAVAGHGAAPLRAGALHALGRALPRGRGPRLLGRARRHRRRRADGLRALRRAHLRRCRRPVVPDRALRPQPRHVPRRRSASTPSSTASTSTCCPRRSPSAS